MKDQAMYPLEAILYLIACFGTVITLLLGIIGFMLKRWVTRLDVRLDQQDVKQIATDLQVAKNSTEIKNIHHRLRMN